MKYIHSSENVKIAFEDMNPKGDDTVLFIHGWPLDHRIFEYQYSMLLEQGIRCVGVDLRGFGASDVPGDGYDYTQMAQDVNQIVESLGLEKFTLAGFSMGGAIAIRYMSLFGGFQVNKLALLAAAAPCFTQRSDFPYGLDKEDVNALITQARVDRPQMVADFNQDFFASTPSEALKDWFQQIGWSVSGVSAIQTAISLRDEDLREDLSEIRVPTGIFHGKLDKVCPFALAEELHEGIADSAIYSFERSGHAIFLDELDEFNRSFLRFVEGAL